MQFSKTTCLKSQGHDLPYLVYNIIVRYSTNGFEGQGLVLRFKGQCWGSGVSVEGQRSVLVVCAGISWSAATAGLSTGAASSGTATRTWSVSCTRRWPMSGLRYVVGGSSCQDSHRVPTVREKSGKNEFFSRSGKSQGILKLVREIW